MKVFVLAPNENWILDRIANEWAAECPEMTTTDPNKADVIWLVSSFSWRKIPARILEEKKVVATIHHVVMSKFTKESLREFLARDKFVDAYHVPCQKTKEVISQITMKPIHVIGYWYNDEIWKPTDKNNARETLDLQKDKFVVGSFQRDTEGHDLKSPKLEKGPDLFFDYVNNNFDKKNTVVLLGGWRRQYIINRLEEAGIEYKYFEMASLEKLKIMYAACDLYVVSSRVEGGPQAILESAAMKVPIVSTDVGMATAVLSDNCIFNVGEQHYEPTDADVEENYQRVSEFELKRHVKKYKKMLEDTLN